MLNKYKTMSLKNILTKKLPGQARTNVEDTTVAWILVGATAIMIVVVMLISILSIERKEKNMVQLMGEKGSALITALEGSLRTGLRSHFKVSVQQLLEELASNKDILFITVAMPDGTIIAHSNILRLGEVIMLDEQEITEENMKHLDINTSSQWRTLNMENVRAFVVYRKLLSLQRKHRSRIFKNSGLQKPIIFLGLNPAPFEDKRADDRTQMFIFVGFTLLAGTLCILALYLTYRVRESKRRQNLAEDQILLLEEEVRLKEKLASVGILAAGVAHEIRNPLSSIKGYATYFGQLFPEDSENRKAANVMVKEVDRLNRVITDLIGLSKPTDVKLKPTKPEQIAEYLMRLIAQEAEQHKVKLHLNVAQNSPPALLDNDRFAQALLNVCLNSLDAMPDGGDLNINIYPLRNKYLCIEVKDTGIGIPPQNIKHIFDPYFTSKNKGTGLGLATVHKIIEAHGGEIKVKSNYNLPNLQNGTTFTFLIPIAKDLQ